MKGPKPTSKKSPTPKRPPWPQAFHDEILTRVIHPALLLILEEGVKSRADLRDRFSERYSTSLSYSTLRKWLTHLDLDHLFDQTPLIRLPPSQTQSPTPTQTPEPTGPSHLTEEDKQYLQDFMQTPPAPPRRSDGGASPADKPLPMDQRPRTII